MREEETAADDMTALVVADHDARGRTSERRRRELIAVFFVCGCEKGRGKRKPKAAEK